MKRVTAILLLLVMVLSLAACGGKKEVNIDLDALYASFADKLPQMMVLDENFQMALMGIPAEDCTKSVVAMIGDGSLRADEVWLIQAKDADALARLKTLAENRVKMQLDSARGYTEDQVPVLEDARILTAGLYLAVLVSPDAASMQAAFEAAAK